MILSAAAETSQVRWDRHNKFQKHSLHSNNSTEHLLSKKSSQEEDSSPVWLQHKHMHHGGAAQIDILIPAGHTNVPSTIGSPEKTTIQHDIRQAENNNGNGNQDI